MPTYAAGSRQPASISYLDAGGERTSFHIWGKTLTTDNLDDQLTAWADVLTAADGLVLGARIKDVYNDETTYPVVRPTNGAAREVALQVVFRDATTGQTWTADLGTLNIGLITYDPNINSRDAVIMTTTAVALLKTKLEAFPVVNPDDLGQTHAVTVVGMQVIRGKK